MSEATTIVHWPGKDTPACEEHARKLEALAHAMGFLVSASRIIPPTVLFCTNCENERRKKTMTYTAPPDPKNFPLVARRAEFVYEAARLYAMLSEAPVVPRSWLRREPEFRERFLTVVERQCKEGFATSPEELHKRWIEDYQAMGWTYGDEYDPDQKKHPDLVPWSALGEKERAKDAVFLALCEVAYNHLR